MVTCHTGNGSARPPPVTAGGRRELAAYPLPTVLPTYRTADRRVRPYTSPQRSNELVPGSRVDIDSQVLQGGHSTALLLNGQVRHGCCWLLAAREWRSERPQPLSGPRDAKSPGQRARSAPAGGWGGRGPSG